ncbi:MAG: ATP-binding cassette domain-containing protein [Alphaproteobacteria bacterium]|nr:ATP-binding cassette domain-containing protein [Alphaproteobacteria bacterium]
MIHIEEVRLRLQSHAGPVDILRGVDLGVAVGEAVAVLGPSGSGKSTLLMVIAGLERPSSGRVAVGGCDIQDLDEDALALFRRRHVGIVFQSFHLVQAMTALENVAVPLELGGHDDPFQCARDALDRVGLAERVEHYPAELSGGEQQRVAIARAFAPGPDLILADEPTGNLDRATGAQVIETLFSLRAETGATLLLITHDQDLAARCSRIVTMSDGRIDSPAEADPP